LDVVAEEEEEGLELCVFHLVDAPLLTST